MPVNQKNIVALKENETLEFKELAEIHAKNFKHLTEIESVIIRGHILLEHALNNAIAQSILHKDEYQVDRFTFSQKVIIGYMLGMGITFKKEITAINKLRNQIAHSLKHEEKYIDIIISEISKKYPQILNLKSKQLQLGTAISFICGAIAVSPKYIRKLMTLTDKLAK